MKSRSAEKEESAKLGAPAAKQKEGAGLKSSSGALSELPPAGYQRAHDVPPTNAAQSGEWSAAG